MVKSPSYWLCAAPSMWISSPFWKPVLVVASVTVAVVPPPASGYPVMLETVKLLARLPSASQPGV